MEELFNKKELINDPFQDPMGEDAHRGLELFMNKFHQPTVPTHTIITDPEYYVMLWFHNANGNLIHCPYVQMPGAENDTKYENHLTPDLEFYKMNRAFGSENNGIQSGTIYNAGFNAAGDRSVYGKSWESLYLHEKCLDLTPFVREASLPDIMPANAERIKTLFGETTAGSFSPYASDGQRSITLNVLDTEFCILDAIFYPWMRDINSPWWYKPYQAYTEWATPYPMATLEIQRPRMRYRTDYPNFNEQSRVESKYVYYSYKFIGVKPTSYTSFEVNGAGRNNLLRTLTMVADMCIVDLDEDARGTQDERSNYGKRETLIFNQDWKNPEDGTEDSRIYVPDEQKKIEEEKKHLDEVEKYLDDAKKELEQQKSGDQPGKEILEYPDMGRKMKEWSTEFRRDPESRKKHQASESGDGEQKGSDEQGGKKEEVSWKDYLDKASKGEVPPPWKSQGQEGARVPGPTFLDGKIYWPNDDGTWREQDVDHATKEIFGNHEYTYDQDTQRWVQGPRSDGFPRGEFGYGKLDNLSEDERKRYDAWAASGDVVYAPGLDGKMVRGQNGKWEEVPDSEVPKEWSKDETGRWRSSDPNGQSPWNSSKYEQTKSKDDEELDKMLDTLEEEQKKQWNPQPASPPASSQEQPSGNDELDYMLDQLENGSNGTGNTRSRDGQIANAGGMAREIQAVLNRYSESEQVFLQDSNQTFTAYRETLEESVAKKCTKFGVFPDLDYPEPNTSISCGYLNNCMTAAFPAMWDMLNLAQNHLASENRNMSGSSGLGRQQMKDYVRQIQRCTDMIALASGKVDELNTAQQDILSNMEFVGKVVASVFKASQIIGDRSAFVGEFGNLIHRMMDDGSSNPAPIQNYVDIVSQAVQT